MLYVLLLLHLTFSVGEDSGYCYDTDVLIVGGGISGITVLSKLLENGVQNVKLFEAQPRLGGRIVSHHLDDIVIELGANWIHGVQNNPITDFVRKGKIRGQVENPSSIICRDSQGRNCTSEFLNERENLEEVLHRISAKSDNHSWVTDQWLPKERKFKTLRLILQEEGWYNDSDTKNIAEISLIDFQDAVPPEMLSAKTAFKNAGNINSLSDAQYFVTDQRGYASILDQLTDKIESLDKFIELNRTVQKISWNKNGARVLTADGNSINARVVLTTASIGVLKTSTLFEPPLPSWKQKAIASFDMATYMKIFLKFPAKFWDDVEYIFYRSLTRGYYPVWQSLDAENRMLVESNILIVTVTDFKAEQIEYMDEKDVIEEIMDILKGMYGSHIPYPKSYVIPKWGINPNFLGSYSYTTPLLTHQDFLDMQANVGPLFFSGEALHETYQGYLHGAYCQAESVSYDIISFLKHRCNENAYGRAEYYDKCYRDLCGGCSKT